MLEQSDYSENKGDELAVIGFPLICEKRGVEFKNMGYIVYALKT